MNVQCILVYCWGNVSAALLKFEAFIKEAILVQRHLVGFCSINVSSRAEGTGRGGGGKAAWVSFTDGIL